MDGVSIASGIISIATAGIQISIKLITLSTQVSSASERVSSIANDVSLTSGVLHQLGDLMNQKRGSDGVSVFNDGGLKTTSTSAAMCERIFLEIEKECGRASEQIRSCRKISGGKVKLSKSEKLRWPFLQPSIEILRADLREAKGTLMLMLQVTTLALAKKMADLSATATNEQGDLYRTIIALRQEQKEQNADGSTQKFKQSNPTSSSRPKHEISSNDFQQVMLLKEQNPMQMSPPIPERPRELASSASELQMFMMKPIVKDFFDRIELSWSVLQPKMQTSVVNEHLARIEADGLPSVVDMLEILHDHEHSMLEVHQGEGELRSLKRTRTDIQHRDILFKGVPGLQFIVESRQDLSSTQSRKSLDDSYDAVLPESDKTLNKEDMKSIEQLGVSYDQRIESQPPEVKDMIFLGEGMMRRGSYARANYSQEGMDSIAGIWHSDQDNQKLHGLAFAREDISAEDRENIAATFTIFPPDLPDGRRVVANPQETKGHVSDMEMEDEYSSADDEYLDEAESVDLPQNRQKKWEGGSAADRKFVEDLLQQYTTWQPPNRCPNLPGGVL